MPAQYQAVRAADTVVARQSCATGLANNNHLKCSQVLFSASVVDVQLPGGSSPNITVQLQTSGTAAAIEKGSLSGNGKQANTQDSAVSEQSDSFSMTCNLLIGADGAGSAVRRSLEKAQPGKGWEVKQYPCRSAQLLWKVRWLCSPWWLSLVLGLFLGWPTSVKNAS